VGVVAVVVDMVGAAVAVAARAGAEPRGACVCFTVAAHAHATI
jgi:hypothetical protein